MRFFGTVSISLFFITPAATLLADKPPLDCARRSLASAVSEASTGDVIVFTGICRGPITINTDKVTLTGVGGAVIDGNGSNALTISGIHAISLNNFEVRNGANGVLAQNGAHIAIKDLNVHDNRGFGITLQTASSALISGVTASHNGVHGLDLETGSAATVSGEFTSSANRVFGINVNGSAITFSVAKVNVSGNAVGVQIATSGNAFINDPATSLTVTGNLADGLTIVSGAHMVSFGGTITASGNGLNGVSVNSKAGLDLDAGSLLETSGNGVGLLLQQGSVMTIFNIPQFSGAPGFSTVNSHNNAGAGIQVSASTLTTANNAKVITMTNGGAGFSADEAVSTLVNSTATGNTGKDVLLTFGTRADLSFASVGTFSCDATVLLRGTTGFTCPH